LFWFYSFLFLFVIYSFFFFFCFFLYCSLFAMAGKLIFAPLATFCFISGVIFAPPSLLPRLLVDCQSSLVVTNRPWSNTRSTYIGSTPFADLTERLLRDPARQNFS